MGILSICFIWAVSDLNMVQLFLVVFMFTEVMEFGFTCGVVIVGLIARFKTLSLFLEID